MPLVTVITVTKNNFTGLESTLQSVQMQNYPKIEHIVIDGDSNDNSSDLFQKYATDATTFISEPDKGIYDAMNKGISLASKKSQYTIFMNAGDVFCATNTINDVLNKAKNFEKHLYGNLIQNNKQTKSIESVSYYKLSTNMVCHQAIFFLTSSLVKYKYNTNYKLCADYYLLLQLLKNREQFEYINLPIVIYDRTGVSSQKRNELRKEKMAIRKHFPLVQFWYSIKNQWLFRIFKNRIFHY